MELIEIIAKLGELEAQNEALAAEAEALKNAGTLEPYDDTDLVGRVQKLEEKPAYVAAAQDSITLKASKKAGIPTDTFQFQKKKVKLAVGGIRLDGKIITAAEILAMPAKDRSDLIEVYPNLVTPA